MYTLAIDPSIKHTGVALFLGQELQWARVVTSAEPTSASREVRYKAMADLIKEAVGPAIPAELILEFPEIYPRHPARPNDLMLLAGLTGYLAGSIEALKVITYLPKQWKGQLPKDVCITRVSSKLTPTELWRVSAGDKTDAWDAVGIGLFRLRRFGK